MTDLLLYLGIPLMYIIVAAGVGGYLYRTKYEKYGFWDEAVIGVTTVFFPITLFWFLFAKPTAKLGIYLGNWKLTKEENKRENLRLIRKQLEQTQQELQDANKEVERILEERESMPAIRKMVAR